MPLYHFHRAPTGSAVVTSVLAAFPVACFTLTLLTDLAYWASAQLMWQDFSAWLLLAGLVFGGLAILAWLVGQATHRHPVNWGAAILNLVVLVLAVLNSLVHAGDGWTGVVPWGLGLSALTVLVMLVSGVVSWSSADRLKVSHV